MSDLGVSGTPCGRDTQLPRRAVRPSDRGSRIFFCTHSHPQESPSGEESDDLTWGVGVRELVLTTCERVLRQRLPAPDLLPLQVPQTSEPDRKHLEHPP